MDQTTLDTLNGAGISDSEAARLGADLIANPPSSSLHVTASGGQAARIMGVNVPLSAMIFVGAGLVLMIVAMR